MKRKPIVLIAILLLVYLSMNLYVFLRFSSLFSIERNLLFYLLLFVSFISFISFTFLEKYAPSATTKVFYIVSVTWSGILLFFVCSFLIYDIANLFFVIPKSAAGIFVISFSCLLSVYSLINAAFIKIKTVEVPTKNLKKEMKIVQLSDMHLGTVHNSHYLKRIVNKTNSLNPDVTVITGDLFDGTAPLSEEMVSLLNEIKGQIFFTIGNHEIYEGVDNIFKILKSTKVKVLRNEIVIHKGLQIIGLEHSFDEKYLGGFLDKMKINKLLPTVLLYHPPFPLKCLDKTKIDLHLAGHLHGGQIFPISIIAKVAYSYYKGFYKGLHKKGDSYIYVSSGTGTWGPPMRLGSKSEITLLKLKGN